MNAHDAPEALRLPPPNSGNPPAWEWGVEEGLKFPERFLLKCKELFKLRQHSAQQQTQLDFVVRNLLSLLENCDEVLAELRNDAGRRDGAATGQAESASPPDQPADAEGAAKKTLSIDRLGPVLGESVRRKVLNMFETLRVVEVDLVGKTYETVAYQGRKIEDPFEVVGTIAQEPGAQPSKVGRAAPVAK